MNETGFLAPWLRDLGAAVGLITGLFAASKAFLEGRPFSYLEPDQTKGTLKAVRAQCWKAFDRG